MIIVDSNIIFSALLTADSSFLSIISDDSKKFASPYFLFIEMFKHKEKILKYSKIKEQDLLITLDLLLSYIRFVPIEILSKSSRAIAYDLCKDIDENDSIFVALTLEMDGHLWTGDKKLIAGLQKKGFNKFYTP